MDPEKSSPEESVDITTLRWDQAGVWKNRKKANVAGAWWVGRSDTRRGWKARQRWISTLISDSACPFQSQSFHSHPNWFLQKFSFSTKVFPICLLNQTLKLRTFFEYFRIIVPKCSFSHALLFLPIDTLSQYLITLHLYCNNSVKGLPTSRVL